MIRTHCIPVGNLEPVHECDIGCWCHPVQDAEPSLYTHNAQDCREKMERQGLVVGPWVIIHESDNAPTGTEARVCEDMARRQALGLSKYGTTVEANPLDLAIYLKRSIEELEKQ
jgi:hypothetical protein